MKNSEDYLATLCSLL